MRSLAEVISLVSASPDFGLTDASVEQSRQQFGKNVLTPLPREPLWKKFLEKFDEPIIKILLAAALLSMIGNRPWPDNTTVANRRCSIVRNRRHAACASSEPSAAICHCISWPAANEWMA